MRLVSIAAASTTAYRRTAHRLGWAWFDTYAGGEWRRRRVHSPTPSVAPTFVVVVAPDSGAVAGVAGAGPLAPAGPVVAPA